MAKPIGADQERGHRTPSQVFGRAITELRVSRNITQIALSESLGYSSYYLGKIERGDANVSCNVMASIAHYFDLTIGQLWIYAEKLAKKPSTKK